MSIHSAREEEDDLRRRPPRLPLHEAGARRLPRRALARGGARTHRLGPLRGRRLALPRALRPRGHVARGRRRRRGRGRDPRAAERSRLHLRRAGRRPRARAARGAGARRGRGDRHGEEALRRDRQRDRRPVPGRRRRARRGAEGSEGAEGSARRQGAPPRRGGQEARSHDDAAARARAAPVAGRDPARARQRAPRPAALRLRGLAAEPAPGRDGRRRSGGRRFSQSGSIAGPGSPRPPSSRGGPGSG